jgi:probable selenium-dependent hydroxylase accessory protein YqeC
MPPVIETNDPDAAVNVADRLEPGQSIVACTGIGPRARLLGFQPATIAALAALGPGLIAVESDGSAQRPFKAPGEHEPAIPAAATDVIVCVGLDVLGRELGARSVHRPELVATLAQASHGDPVTADMIVRVLLHDRGGRRAVPPGARIHALLNNPPTAEHEALGMHIAERLVYEGFWRAVVATAHRPQGDVRAVVK